MNIESKNTMKLFKRNIPEELSILPQWVAWSGTAGRNGKISKVPYSPCTGRFAKTNDAKTWSTFDETLKFTTDRALPGVGFVFSEHDEFVGIDLDNCIDPNTGSINDQAQEIIGRLDSFTEISPSGRGIHIIAKGKLPVGSRRSGNFEIYDNKRFFTVTGNRVAGTPNAVMDRTAEIQKLHQDVFNQDKPTGQTSSTRFELDDRVLIEMAKHAENGEKFRRLWVGDFKEYPSQSEADLALCKMLSFWTNRNLHVIDRLFRQSGLYRPKWDHSHFANGQTYGQATIGRALSTSEDTYRQHAEAADAETTQREFHLTDLGNAERLVFHFGDRIRYCHAWKTWIIWDGIRWVPDHTDKIRQLAKKVIRMIYSEAEQVDDPNKRQSIAKHAMNSESEKRIRSMISLAQSEVPITPDELDQNKRLLTCLNGTVDLRSGNLLPHNKEDFITKLAAINYDSDAICPTWLDFLDRIMDGNDKLISFLQRAIGYSLTGETSEQCIFILYGSGANGKSTFLQAVSSALGDYSMSTPTETLLVKHRGAIPNDVARLKGARFVIASEAEAEQRLAESLIKQMTGGDTISARFLHQEWFDFNPTHKIFVGTNHKPVIKGTDFAIWRRIRLIPFEITIPEPEMDKNLAKKLKAEAAGILAWSIKGCLRWQEQGLGEPDEVRTATETYREEMDILADFLKDRCMETVDGKTPSKDLYGAYTSWCEENGQKPVSPRAFGSGLREKGFKQFRLARMRGWSGIALV